MFDQSVLNRFDRDLSELLHSIDLGNPQAAVSTVEELIAKYAQNETVPGTPFKRSKFLYPQSWRETFEDRQTYGVHGSMHAIAEGDYPDELYNVRHALAQFVCSAGKAEMPARLKQLQATAREYLELRGRQTPLPAARLPYDSGSEADKSKRKILLALLDAYPQGLTRDNLALDVLGLESRSGAFGGWIKELQSADYITSGRATLTDSGREIAERIRAENVA